MKFNIAASGRKSQLLCILSFSARCNVFLYSNAKGLGFVRTSKGFIHAEKGFQHSIWEFSTFEFEFSTCNLEVFYATQPFHRLLINNLFWCFSAVQCNVFICISATTTTTATEADRMGLNGF